MTTLRFSIPGVPQSQGSLRAITAGNSQYSTLTSTNKRLKPWRQDVRWMAAEDMRRRGVEMAGVGVSIVVKFIFLRPKARKKEQWKTTAPDLDKLQRALFDALTGIVYHDDRQIYAVSAFKQYGDRDETLVEVSYLEYAVYPSK